MSRPAIGAAVGVLLSAATLQGQVGTRAYVDGTWPMRRPIAGGRSVPCAYGVAVGPGGHAYATSICRRLLSRLEIGDGTVDGNVDVGDGPAHVAIDPAGLTLYTTDQLGRSVTVVGAPSGNVLARIPIPGGREAYNVAVSPDGCDVYVAIANTGLLRVVDLAARRVVRTIQVGTDLRNVAVAADGSVVVADQGAGTVHVVRP